MLLRASSSHRNDSLIESGRPGSDAARYRSLEFALTDDVNGGVHWVAIELATDVPRVSFDCDALGGGKGGEHDGFDLSDVGVRVQWLVQLGADRVEMFVGRRHVS